jgi:hypothetical protein
MRRACLILAVLVASSSLGCAYRAGCAADGCAIAGELADVRIGGKYVTAGSVELEKTSDAASEQFMGMIEEVLPELVSAAVRAALACAGIATVGEVLGGCQIPTPPDGVLEGAVGGVE